MSEAPRLSGEHSLASCHHRRLLQPWKAYRQGDWTDDSRRKFPLFITTFPSLRPSFAKDNVLHNATMQIRILLERFANGKSMDIIIDAINTLIDDARSDEEFRQWFQSVDAYSRKVLLEPGYVLEPMCNSEGRKVRDSGRRFYDEKYKAHFDRLFDAIGTWFSAMGEDPLNKRFGDDWARLTHDLLFDSEGSLKFKPDLWMDIRKVIVPSIVDRVRPFHPVYQLTARDI